MDSINYPQLLQRFHSLFYVKIETQNFPIDFTGILDVSKFTNDAHKKKRMYVISLSRPNMKQKHLY